MCGKIVDQDIFASDPMFTKDSAGQVPFVTLCLLFVKLCCFGIFILRGLFITLQSRLAGNILVSVESGYSASHERTLMKGMSLFLVQLHFSHAKLILLVIRQSSCF